MQDKNKIDLHDLGIIILAAGASKRLGTPKQLLKHTDGDSFAKRICKMAIGTGIKNISVVIPDNNEHIMLETKDDRISCFFNYPNNEISESILHGFWFLCEQPMELSAILIVVCDQPYLELSLLKQIISLYQNTNASLIASRYKNGAIGTPALFSRPFFNDLITLEGDQGALAIIKQNLEKTHFVEFPLGDFDIDTSEDYETFLHTKNV